MVYSAAATKPRIPSSAANSNNDTAITTRSGLLSLAAAAGKTAEQDKPIAG